MGGDIQVSSQSEQGSTFSLTLPLDWDTAQPQVPEISGLEKVWLAVADDWQRTDYQRHLKHWGITAENWPLQGGEAPALSSTSLLVIDLPDHEQSDALAGQAHQVGATALQLYDIGQSNEWINSHGQPQLGFKDRPPFGALLLPLITALLDGNSKAVTVKDPQKGHKLNILAADDNAVNRSVVSAMLAKLGHNCVLACDGEDAVTQFLYASRPFDLVLMDCEMPVLDGLGAMRCIRELETERNITQPTPVVALTANAYQSDRERYLEAGMDDVLTKPISLDRLKSALDKYANHA